MVVIGIPKFPPTTFKPPPPSLDEDCPMIIQNIDVRFRISLHLANIVTIVESGWSEGLFVKMVDNQELMIVKKLLETDDVSSDNKKKQKSMLSVCSDFISLKEEEKENISNDRHTPEEA
ncbi:unnamed protein product [Danaus chrysippus]|uniref:(African queen) hypothetical protein n=1 Tax=Danaus chrysippus TaxID=151541 RepID=A0A8J2QWD4_9NEOP|nr:unnamed protein product [Danaus chrysippus]